MKNNTPEDAGWYLDEYDGPRFWEHVNFRGGKPYLQDPISPLTAEAGECWVWRGWGDTAEKPYGRFMLSGSAKLAHRLGLLEFGARFDKGMDVDHLCRNTLCVRHNHLEAVSHKVNMARGSRAKKTHCLHGHEYTEENTVNQSRNGKTHRYCRTCLTASKRATYLRRKNAA